MFLKAVGSGTLRMVIEVYQSDYKALSRVLAPFLERLSKSGWDELDKAGKSKPNL